MISGGSGACARTLGHSASDASKGRTARRTEVTLEVSQVFLCEEPLSEGSGPALLVRAMPDSIVLVGAKGFEPSTPCSQSRCATRLRYTPTETIFYTEKALRGKYCKM